MSPYLPKAGRCEGCDALILWRKDWRSGKNVPIDADPVRDGKGNVILFGDTYCRVTARGEGTHVTHFTTCPKAEEFRRREAKLERRHLGHQRG